jgi:hypothetical protein
MTIRIRTILLGFIPTRQGLIFYRQSGKSNIDHSIQMFGVAEGLWNGVAFDAIRKVFVVCATRRSWSIGASMTRAAKCYTSFVTAATIAAQLNGTFGAIRAMTNLTIFDGISGLT